MLMTRSFFDDFENYFLEEIGGLRYRWGNSPHTEIKNNEKERVYLIYVDLPGMDEKDVDIEVIPNKDGSILVLKGGENENSERHGVKFTKSFKVPSNIDINGIKAEMKNGVLKVKLPYIGKEKIVEKRKIAINKE